MEDQPSAAASHEIATELFYSSPGQQGKKSTNVYMVLRYSYAEFIFEVISAPPGGGAKFRSLNFKYIGNKNLRTAEFKNSRIHF